jgi:hypothetical protein
MKAAATDGAEGIHEDLDIQLSPDLSEIIIDPKRRRHRNEISFMYGIRMNSYQKTVGILVSESRTE